MNPSSHPIASFIRNPVKVSVGVLLIALFGFIAMQRMPMQLTPEVKIPTITVETAWPGASPEEVEREIVQEQEEQLKSVEGLVKLNSESNDSRGRITLEFLVGTDMEEALLKVNSRLQQVREYPEDADEPVISTSDASDQAIAWFILSPLMISDDILDKFESDHPELIETIAPVRKAHNAGLAVLRLRGLIRDNPDKTALRELLPENLSARMPTRTELETYKTRYPEHRDALDQVMKAERNGAAVVNLRALCDKDPRLEALRPPAFDVSTMRKFAEDTIEASFERVPGVSNSNVLGGRDPEVQVIIDAEKLAARGLTIMDVRQILREQNRNISGGDYWDSKRRYVVRTLGQFSDVEQVRNQVLRSDGEQQVFLRDVAEVRLAHKKPDGFVRRFGAPAIAINTQRETGANVLEVMKGLRKAHKRLNEGPLKEAGLYLTQVSDQTDYIYSSIGLVNQNILVGGGLTVIVLLVFLRSGRSTLVIGLAIPTSIIGTFLVLHLLGRSLNVISLAGLAFAVGMLVDNSVVVLENIYRYYQRGVKPFEAAEKATKEVWGAVIASTLTTLAVFIPVVFVQEEAGQLFRDIALAISSAVGLSLLVSVTVIPTATARILRENQIEPKRRGVIAAINWPLDRLGNAFVAMVVGVTTWIQRGVLRKLAVIVLLVGSAGVLSYFLWPEMEYLPTGNRNLVFGVIRPPPGYNLEKLEKMGSRVEAKLRPYWDVDLDSPEAKDRPVIYDFFYVARGRSLFFGARAVDPLRAGDLVPVINDVRAALPGTMVFASKASLFGRALAAGRTIDIEITGPSIEKLVQIGGRMMGQIPNTVYFDANGNNERDEKEPGARAQPIPSVDLSSPEVHVRAHDVRSAQVGLRNGDVGYIVNAIVDGAYATDYYIGGDKIDVSIMGQRDYGGNINLLSGIPIATPSGELVPLSAIANVELRSGPEQINHRERQRAITIQVTPPNETSLEAAIESIESNIVAPLRAGNTLEGGYNITLSGTADKLRQTWQALKWNFVLALLITYLLMAALFESWIYPLVIIMTVPLGAVGGILGLRGLSAYLQLFNEPPAQLDILTMLGFVILIGTVVNNAILIVHQSLNHIREGMAAREAIVESVRSRIRPIFMTTTTTVFGLAPLVFFPGAGSELYRGVGSVVLGGLLISTIFTLVLIPTVFSLTIDVRQRIFGSAR